MYIYIYVYYSLIGYTSFRDLGSPFEQEDITGDNVERLGRALDECSISKQNDEFFEEDHTDVCFLVDNKRFRCHRFLLGARSEYLKARLSRTTGFREGAGKAEVNKSGSRSLLVLQEHDLSAGAFEKVLEYM